MTEDMSKKTEEIDTIAKHDDAVNMTDDKELDVEIEHLIAMVVRDGSTGWVACAELKALIQKREKKAFETGRQHKWHFDKPEIGGPYKTWEFKSYEDWQSRGKE